MLIMQAQDWRQEIEQYRTDTYNMHLAMVERVILLMRKQLREPLSLEDMADMACMSPYYFNRIFHRIVGIPPGEFLTTLRLDAAKQLLLTTSLSVTDICFEVGYVGLGSFTTRFTRLVGVSPGHLRYCAKSVVPSFLANASAPIDCLAEHVPQRGDVIGEIRVEVPFKGVIFAGLFRKPIPLGQPVGGIILAAPGAFCLLAIPDGRYFLLISAMPLSEDPHTYLLPRHNETLVGGYGPFWVQHGCIQEPVEVVLRAPRVTDPPIVSVKPYISSFL
jgi:AraC family transcriptional regulator